MTKKLIIKTKILTIEELKNANIDYHLYYNGDYDFETKQVFTI